MSKREKRTYDEVLPVAEHITDVLAPYCQRIEIAGSLRRKRPMIGDIEICAIPKRPRNLLGEELRDQDTELDLFLSGRLGDGLIKNGRKYKQFRYGRFTVDLFLPAPETWGSIYFIRTGSHEWNLWVMRTAAPSAGMKFEGGYLYDKAWNQIVAAEEEDVFEALGLPFVPPQMRDDNQWMEMTHGNDTNSSRIYRSWRCGEGSGPGGGALRDD